MWVAPIWANLGSLKKILKNQKCAIGAAQFFGR